MKTTGTCSREKDSRSYEEEHEATAKSYDGGRVAMLPGGGNPDLKCKESAFILIF